ncbi:MAG: hypothetical protein U5K27_17760 [Desulfotignum sp.]|nr:hypothetical protein [Desulfotignum sp.]
MTFDPVLDFFLADRRQGVEVNYPLTRSASVKDIIESLGVPIPKWVRSVSTDR